MVQIMAKSTTVLERAFQLAKTGQCDSLDELKRGLRDEGYSDVAIWGSTLLKQLRTLIKQAEDQSAQ